ncbi:MAG: M15 family metallopeptidase [Clostridia bacterium]|nr:M15 family metallopeptidase [Clostridia bacterium]
MTRTPSPMIRGWRPAAEPTPPAHLRLWPLCLVPVLLLGAACLLLHAPQPDTQVFPLHAPVVTPQPVQVSSLPPRVTDALPVGELHHLSVPTQRLMQGRMLLIDEHHPLPDGYTPADTLAVLHYTQGRVLCRDLTAVSGQDTLDALTELFIAARNDRIIQLTVFAGTRSSEQQRILQTDALADFSRDMPLEDALLAARQAVASPECSEHQTPWAVDIRVCPVWNGAPENAPYAASAAGQWLTANCWRYGFILRWPQASPQPHSCRAWHLRYVGRAHAMLMHALGVSFEEYLDLLHEYGTLTLLNENGAPLCAAVCQPAGEHQTSFQLPQAEIDDLSLDNQGWAIAACLFTEPFATP